MIPTCASHTITTYQSPSTLTNQNIGGTPPRNGCSSEEFDTSERQLITPRLKAFESLTLSEQKLLQLIEKNIESSKTPYAIFDLADEIQSDLTHTVSQYIESEHALVILEGALTAHHGDRTYSLNSGYVFTDLHSIIEHPDKRISLDENTQSLLVLCIPRKEFQKWLSHDAELAHEFQLQIDEAFPTPKMPLHARERIRAVRDGNIMATLTRESIRLVNSSGGIFDILNPSGTNITNDGGGETIPRIGQIWSLIEICSNAALFMDQGSLNAAAKTARQQAIEEQNGESEADVTAAACHHFERIIKNEEDLISATAYSLIPSSLISGEQLLLNEHELIRRVLQINWLNRRLLCQSDAPSELDTIRLDQECDFSRHLLAYQDIDEVERALDHADLHLEVLFNLGASIQHPDIVSMNFSRLVTEVAPLVMDSEELNHSHPIYRLLSDLNDRMEHNETSAVGGSAYADMRFSQGLLEMIAQQEIPVVVHDGSHKNGIDYIRQRWGRNDYDPTILNTATIVDLKGIYGEFSKSLVCFRDGRSVLLVSYMGEGRQLSNAAALLLYENAEGKRIDIKNIILSRDCETSTARINRDLEEVFVKEHAYLQETPIFGQCLNPDTLPTQAVIIQHPEQLAKFIGTAMVTHEHRTSSLGTLMVGYYQSPDGTFARLIMPKVGSAGVYGDTAGAFLKCFFDSKHILNPISDIVFSGTAGGFANTSKYDHFDSERFQGLPQMNVGDIFIPRAFIGDGENMYSLRTAIDLVPNNWIADESGVLDRCKKSLEKANVHHTSAHFSIAAPALETFELIDSLISQGYSSIDVESAPIMEAIREIQGRQPDITFTPLYVYSDDPLNARDDLWASLAYGAPLAEGSRNNHQLHGALRSLIDLSINKKTSFIAG